MICKSTGSISAVRNIKNTRAKENIGFFAMLWMIQSALEFV